MRRAIFLSVMLLFGVLLGWGQSYKTIAFSSTESGAKIYSGVDGTFLGTTPFSKDIELEYKDKPYFAVKDGCQPVYKTINPYINSSLNFEISVRREMAWRSDVVIDLLSENKIIKTISNDIVTEFYDKSLNNTGISLNDVEKQYYFDNGNTISDNDGGYPNLLTLKSATVLGWHIWEVHWENQGTFPWSYKADTFWANYFLWVEIWQEVNCQTKDGSRRTKNLYVGPLGDYPYFQNSQDGTQNIVEDIMINDINTISSDIIYSKEIIFGRRPNFSVTPKSHTQIQGEEPAWKRLEWQNVHIMDKVWYLAKSPVPRIKTTNMHPDIPTTLHHQLNFLKNELLPVSIEFGYPVKMAGYFIFDSNDVCINKRVECAADKNGFSSFNIAGISTLAEGNYRFVLAVVDKFNKFYMFKEETFVIDKSPPKIAGVNEGPSPKILSWSDVSDDSSPFPNESDYFLFSFIHSNGDDPISYQNKKYPDVASIISYNSVTKSFCLINGLITDLTITLIDGAGNKGITDLTTDARYFNDNSPPTVSYDDIYKTKIFKKDDDFKLTLKDNLSPIYVSNVKFTYGGGGETLIVGPDGPYTSPAIINLNSMFSTMSGYEGNFSVSLNVSDGTSDILSNLTDFKFDDKSPDLMISLGSDVLPLDNTLFEKNGKGASLVLKIMSADTNFDKQIITITSDYSGSENIFSGTVTASLWTKNLITHSNRVYEDLTITVSSKDRVNNTTDVIGKIRLYNDNNPPAVSNPTTTEVGYEKTFSVKITDTTGISKVWIKNIDISTWDSLRVANVTDFDSGIPDITKNWILIGKDLINNTNNTATPVQFNNDISLYTGSAFCIITEDVWGNKASPFIGQNTYNASLINIVRNKDELKSKSTVTVETELDGSIKTHIRLNQNIIFKPSNNTDANLVIEENEVFKIMTETNKIRDIIFDNSSGNIKITNKGKIIFDNAGGNIVLRGTISGNFNYSWSGIHSLNTGSVVFNDNSNRVVFKNAYSPLSYYFNPPKDIGVTNVDFFDCFMGIHFVIDNYDEANTRSFQVKYCTFKRLVYGIKFDIINIYSGTNNLKFDYSKYLTLTGDEKTFEMETILKGKIYSPNPDVGNKR